MSSSATGPTQAGLTRYVSYCETISDPHETHLLSFSRIVGSEDIFLERFYYKMMPDDESNIGCLSKIQIACIRIEYGWHELSKDESIPLKTRYMDLIEKNYKGFPTIRDTLHPIVKGFVKPLPLSKCYGIQDEYREEYYKKRLGSSKYYEAELMDDDEFTSLFNIGNDSSDKMG